MYNRHKRLGELLTETQIISQDQLEQATIIQQTTGERLDTVLVKMGLISEESMIEVLEFQLGVPHIDLSDNVIERKAALQVPAALAERHKIIAVKRQGRKLTLAMADPTNFIAIDDVKTVTGFDVEPVIATENQIVKAISHIYGVNDLVERAVSRLRPDDMSALRQVQTADDAPIIGIVNSLFSSVVQERGSDIHIEPQERVLRVRFRVDGILREVLSFPMDIHAAIVNRVKIMSEMDIAEKRIPQDGRLKIREAGRDIDIRVSTLPTIFGEKVVMRILDKSDVLLNINKLGFSPSNKDHYQRLYTQSYGMILVTGPTGSGKTTTLYSTLAAVNSPGKNIITIEDPVEYHLDGVNQVQVNVKAGMTFANSLRSILRQDPNIIMVGEIRDGETADIAVRAALTGHLVLSTLHTNDAAGAISRLTDMGTEPFLVASSVLGVVAQRLVRCICPECKTTYSPPADSAEIMFLGMRADQSVSLYRGRGCSSCNGTGYRGRMPIHEVMPISGPIRDLVNRRVSSDELKAAAVQAGMITLREDGIQKAFQGLTTIEEVMRVAYAGV